MTLMTYVNQGDAPVFAVVVEGSTVEYVWPTNRQPLFDGAQRTEWLIRGAAQPPKSEAELLALSVAHLGDTLDADHPYDDFDSLSDAVATAQSVIDASISARVAPRSRTQLMAEEAFSQVAQDYPGFGDDLASLDPEAMDNFVLMALGPIDPEGPNGWILRAMDGNPRPGDENEYVHLAVGSPSSDEVTNPAEED